MTDTISIPLEVLESKRVSMALDNAAELLSEALTSHFYGDAPADFMRELDDQLRDFLPAVLFGLRLPSLGQMVAIEAEDFLEAL